MRKYLQNIHALLGLFCIPYLLIFGVSSLNFNHHIFLLERKDNNPVIWEKEVITENLPDDSKLAEVINDSLGIMGWFIPWNVKRDTLNFKYDVAQLAKKYRIEYFFINHRVRVSIYPNSFSNILKGLHGLGENIPNAPWWINLWKYYQDLSVYALLFWVISGIWLWSMKRKDRKWGILILGFMTLFSICLIFYVWLAG